MGETAEWLSETKRVEVVPIPDSGRSEEFRFRLDLTRHETDHRFPGALAAMKDGIDFLADGHFNADTLAEFVDGTRSLDAFRDHFRGPKNVLQRFALSDAEADGVISGMLTRAGRNQIAHARKSREGFRTGSQRDSEPGDLDQAACHERCAAVVAEPETVGDTCCDGNDVLHSAAEFDAPAISGRVYPEMGAVEQALDEFGVLTVRRGGNDRGW